MISGNNVVCGTSSTGTGTLTLAACPTSVGGVDFDVWARGALSAADSATLNVPYALIEYTDSTFATPKQAEYGIGVLTLGASSGIANCTFSRNYPGESQTGLSTQPASLSFGTVTGYVNPSGTPPSATLISIGAASNTLLFISEDARAGWAAKRVGYQANGSGAFTYDALGSGSSILQYSLTSGTALFSSVFLPFSDWISTVGVYVSTSLSSPTSSSLELAIYDRIGAKLSGYVTQDAPNNIISHPAVVSSTNPLGSGTEVVFTLPNPIFLRSGFYGVGVLPIWSGGSGTPSLSAFTTLTGLGWGVGSPYTAGDSGVMTLANQTELVANPFSGIDPWNVVPVNNTSMIRVHFRNF